MTSEHFHFIGIGGIGMSALARILLERAQAVSGSDLKRSAIVIDLEKLGAKISVGQRGENISQGATVVVTSAVKEDNPEYQAAVKLGCTILHRSDLLSKLMEGSRVLGVAGTHGKTTTSSLLAETLIRAEYDPSFAIGGVLKELKRNSATGKSAFFVAELDESDGSFLKSSPQGCILTNVEGDHLDYYGSLDRLEKAFVRFIDQVEGEDLFFWCGDDPFLSNLHPKGVSYGYGEQCDLRATNVRQDGWSMLIDVLFEGKTYRDVRLGLVGHHNVHNALAVFGLTLRLGVPEQSIRSGLAAFSGVARRCDKKGTVNGALVIDDYAHHPTEIATTLAGIREADPKASLTALYQPHRYSRTRDCMGMLSDTFDVADRVVVTDVFAAGEEPIEGVNPECIMELIKHRNISYLPRKDLLSLAADGKAGDMIVCLGAGDITAVAAEMVNV